MSTDTREERLARRISDLYATDQQFADAQSSESVTRAIESPELRLPEIVATVIDGYADRPALGQRAVQFVTDPATGRTSAELLPRFDTITYRELSDRVVAVAAASDARIRCDPDDRVAILGFTSIDYTTVDMALLRLGAIAVPLQTSAPLAQLRPIAAETEPVVIASSVEFLDDAVELALDRPSPAAAGGVRLPRRGGRPPRRRGRPPPRGSPKPRSSSRHWPTCSPAAAALPAPPWVERDDDTLALLIYTSGSTGTPKGAMYTVKGGHRRLATGQRRP